LIGIDTNVLLRYLLDDDGDQAPRAIRLIDQECSPTSPALVTNAVLAEAVWYLDLRLKRPKREIIDALWALLDNPHLAFEDSDAVENAVQEFEVGPADFADYLIAMSAAAHGATTTATFDQDAAKRPPFSLLTP
jgi:predicted nucleic-acid-binding protein